jgi:hypothetical protein
MMIRMVFGIMLGSLVVGSSAGGEQTPLPAVLDAFLTEEAHGVAGDREALLSGAPVVKLLDADPTVEVAVFGAVWVNAPSASYIERAKDVEQLERGGGFRITKRISDPPALEDFAALTLPDEDIEGLKTCRIGDCALKVDAFALDTLREEVDFQRPTANRDVNAVFRRLALAYVRGYRAGGNARLAVYRDHDRPTHVANEFRSMIDRLPRLAAQWPDLNRYLLEYPHATLPNATDFLYWQEVKFGLKPTIRISHLIIQDRPGAKVVASKMLYSSHYFWTALEVRVLLDDPARGRGFWFVTVNRSRADGLSGFRGRIIAARVRSEVQDGTRAALTAVKSTLEGRRP